VETIPLRNHLTVSSFFIGHRLTSAVLNLKLFADKGAQAVSDSNNPSNIIWSVVDEEAVLLDTSSGHYFSLNPPATEIWEHLHRGYSVSDIVGTLVEKYRVEEEIVRRDVSELITELRVAGLWA